MSLLRIAANIVYNRLSTDDRLSRQWAELDAAITEVEAKLDTALSIAVHVKALAEGEKARADAAEQHSVVAVAQHLGWGDLTPEQAFAFIVEREELLRHVQQRLKTHVNLTAQTAKAAIDAQLDAAEQRERDLHEELCDAKDALYKAQQLLKRYTDAPSLPLSKREAALVEALRDVLSQLEYLNFRPWNEALVEKALATYDTKAPK